MRYYDTTAIRAVDATYNFVIGERSNGKTTAILRDIIADYHQTGRKGAIIRQMAEDIVGHKGGTLFNAIVAGGMVEELTDNKWSGVVYRRRSYFLTRYESDGSLFVNPDPFAHIFAISNSVHDKSNSYPNVGTIMFDEFMRADQQYLVDEVSLFLNLVSTIVREKDIAKVFLVANTVSWNSPYFQKFGLRDISRMSPGDIAEFDYKRKRPTGEEIVMRVAVEYCESTADYGGKASDKYFIIDDDRVAMITDGHFAIPSYPRCPHHFNADNVKCTYWFHTESGLLRGRLIRIGRDELFIFIESVDQDRYDRYADHRRDVFYSLEFSSKRSHFVSPQDRYASDPRTAFMAEAFSANRLFFESNDVGEDFMYFAKAAKNRSILTL